MMTQSPCQGRAPTVTTHDTVYKIYKCIATKARHLIGISLCNHKGFRSMGPKHVMVSKAAGQIVVLESIVNCVVV